MEYKKVEDTIKQFLIKTDLISEDEIILKSDIATPFFFSLYTNNRFLLGRDGETLQAITYLVKRLIEKNFTEEEAKAITLDINDFHKKRINQLKTTAHMLAERARFFKSSVEVEPMNGYDRRIIHEYLQEYKDISTDSEGVGKDRHVVIKYIEKPVDDFTV